MKNHFVIKGAVTEIIIDSPKYGEVVTVISTSKLERVNEMPNKWTVSWMRNTGSFYVKANITRNGKRITVSLQRWIMGEPKGKLVDHKNHDTLDNTDDNLRTTTDSQNNQNRRGAQRNSKTGVRGVTWDKKNKRWRAQIKLNGRSILIGVSVYIEDAEKAVIAARKKYFTHSNEAVGSQYGITIPGITDGESS